MNELQIIINQQLGVINTNFSEIKESLADQMQIYKELEVTEVNKAERKKDVATLRKMQKLITEKKSEVRNKCLEPYDEFNKLANELTQIIEEPIGIIDNQVKEFEEAQRKIKVRDIEKAFNEIMSNYPELEEGEVGLVNIYDVRWENATASMRSVREDITDKLNKIRNDVVLIKSMVSEKAEEALRLFWGDLDVNSAVTMINRYEQQKREIEHRIQEQQRLEKERELENERERIRKEEREAIAREERAREEERKKAQEEREAKEKAERDAMAIHKLDTLARARTELYAITATQEEFEQVEMYLASIGVDYERMP